jgi:hypothetical protein
VKSANLDRFDKRSCASQIKPFLRDPSDGCVLCLQCVKICPQQNPGFGILKAPARAKKRNLLRPFEAAFVMIDFGVISHELGENIKDVEAFFHKGVALLHVPFPSIPAGLLEPLCFLLLFPLPLWVLIVMTSHLLGHRKGALSLFLAATTAASPIIMVAHFGKAMSKFSAWCGYLPLALRDPLGIVTFNRLAQHTLASPAKLLGLPVVGVLMLAVMLVVTLRIWRLQSEGVPESLVASRTAIVVTFLLFGLLLSGWVRPLLS